MGCVWYHRDAEREIISWMKSGHIILQQQEYSWVSCFFFSSSYVCITSALQHAPSNFAVTPERRREYLQLPSPTILLFVTSRRCLWYNDNLPSPYPSPIHLFIITCIHIPLQDLLIHTLLHLPRACSLDHAAKSLQHRLTRKDSPWCPTTSKTPPAQPSPSSWQPPTRPRRRTASSRQTPAS